MITLFLCNAGISIGIHAIGFCVKPKDFPTQISQRFHAGHVVSQKAARLGCVFQVSGTSNDLTDF